MTPELKALVAKVGLTKEDTLVFVGDLVDKGPDSAGTVQFVRSLRDEGFSVVLVQGNHEEKHSRFRKAFTKGGEKAVKKFKGVDELKSITEALSPEDVAFLDSAVPFFQMPEHDAVVVHAGIPGTVTELDASDKGTVSRILRTRFVTGKANIKLTLEISDLDHLDPEPEEGAPITLEELMSAAGSDLDAVVVRKKVRPAGSFISLGQEGPEDSFWAEVYDGRFGHVFFGHEPFMDDSEPKQFDHATGLDLGAVFGGHLAAAVLVEGEAPTFVTVKASGKFATGLWEE